MKRFGLSGLVALGLLGCGTSGTLAPSTQGDFAAMGAASALLPAKLLVNGQFGATIQSGAPTHLQWVVGDPSGNPLNQVVRDDGKDMHLIIVRSDLSTFAHVHPEFVPERDFGQGGFQLDLNTPTTDPDNQDAAHAIPEPGTYFLFGQTQLPGAKSLSEARASVTAVGPALLAPVTPDPVESDGAIVKYFRSGSHGVFSRGSYQVTLSIANADGMIGLDFHIAESSTAGVGSTYEPVTDLQPWLGMTGHAIMISAAGDTVGQKVFRHVHAGMDDMGAPGGSTAPMPSGSTGPDLDFMLMGPSMVPHGVYKIWCQTEHDNRVLAFPFVVSL